VVLEDVLEVDNVLVVERAVDLDLGEELLLRSLLLEGAFVNNLRCHHRPSLRIRDLEALSKSALPK